MRTQNSRPDRSSIVTLSIVLKLSHIGRRGWEVMLEDEAGNSPAHLAAGGGHVKAFKALPPQPSYNLPNKAVGEGVEGVRPRERDWREDNSHLLFRGTRRYAWLSVEATPSAWTTSR